jgi:GAF domain-containing protein
VLTEREYELREGAVRVGIRAVLSVPMVREGQVVGTITLDRTEPVPFSDIQIALLKTFADQAVIAIENVRLFTELQAKNEALTQANDQVTEALEQQTATAEILRVIASSPASVEAVFDTILANALRLCDTPTGGIFTFDGRAFHIAASAHWADDFAASFREAAILPGPETPLRRVGLELRPSHVAEIFSDPLFSPPEAYRREGMRTALAVPMLKEGRLVGALTFHRREVRPFTETQIALIETFADQAVIAIENVRLFKQLEERNRELTDALDRQTSTADILRVISRSPTDIQQVFDTIVRSASRLCAGHWAAALRFDGELIHLAAQHNIGLAAAEFEDLFPCSPSRHLPLGRAILERELVHIPDAAEDPDIAPGVVRRARSFLVAPMQREGAPIGAIAVSRPTPGPFPPQPHRITALLRRSGGDRHREFRLFQELQARTAELTHSVGELQALGEVGRTLSATLDLPTVLTTIVSRAVQLSGLDGGVVFEYECRGVRPAGGDRDRRSPRGGTAHHAHSKG